MRRDGSLNSAPEVALDEDLVLLGVAAGDDQVVLAAQEPVEALEPVRLPHLLHHRRALLDLHAAHMTALGSLQLLHAA